MNYSDEEIVKMVLAGEKQRYEVLVERYQRPIFNLMFRYVHDNDEAADLSQDVFVRAFDKLHLFRTDMAFFPWLYRLAVNLADDWSRKNLRHHAKMHILQQEALDRQTGEDICARMENKEEHSQVEDALQELADHTRETLILRYRHGCSIRYVADAFNLSESAVKMRIKRGLAQLRTILSSNQNRRS